MAKPGQWNELNNWRQRQRSDYFSLMVDCEVFVWVKNKEGVRGVPGTEKPLEISIKTVGKFGINRKTAQKWTKPRTVGMLGTEKPHQNFGETEKPHKKSPQTAKPQTSDTPPLHHSYNDHLRF